MDPYDWGRPAPPGRGHDRGPPQRSWFVLGRRAVVLTPIALSPSPALPRGGGGGGGNGGWSGGEGGEGGGGGVRGGDEVVIIG